jgi:hypothetical protein
MMLSKRAGQMSDKTTRTYSADDVRQIVEILRSDPEISPEVFQGVELLADILKQFETMTEADIEAEVQAHLRSETPTIP